MNRRNPSVTAFVYLTAGWLFSLTTGWSEEIPPNQLAFFKKHVRPLLANHCYSCHSDDASSLKANLRLDTSEGILNGGNSGPAIIPRKPNESLIIQVVTGSHADLKKMPPKMPLTKTEVSLLRKWITMGAPDPRTTKLAQTEVQSSIDYEAGRTFWAFQAPKRSQPKVKDKKWARTAIDRYVLAGLEGIKARPVRDARPATLLRRAYYDLTGLPPTPEQVKTFVEDERPDAFARVVDELLASPQFGERWGRHWMDVARYAESTGMERNFTYPTAWRYRDYVIKSLNEDKPFNQFVREQIAGDLLPAENAELESEQLVATAFLAMGPKSLNERNKEIFNMDIVDEQIDVTTRAFMGLTVSCARCHDHKFDPISQMDYYSMAGFFTSTKTHYGTGGGNGNRQVSTLIPLSTNDPSKQEAIAAHKQQMKKLQSDLAKAQKIAKSKRPNDQNVIDVWMEKRDEAREQVTLMQKQLKNLRGKKVPKLDQTMGVSDHAAPKDTHFRMRGDVAQRGPVARRGFLPVISKNPFPAIPEKQSGRIELANWIASEDNPLTARVTANRVWKHLFGEGIVRTVDNFGKTGERPGNPALLDYLATRLVEQKWSIKSMVREIMLSRTYQLSSEYGDELYHSDPDNRLFGRMHHRRLDAEAIRDTILFVSGQLDLRPGKGSVLQEIGNTNIGQNTRIQAELRSGPNKKRAVYQPVVRNLTPDFMKTFDFAESSIIVGRRDITTVPTQALLLMNSKAINNHAGRLAERILKEADDRPERLKRAFNLTLCREPHSAEREQFFAFMDEISDDEREQWTLACQTLFASAEFRYLE